MKAQIRIDNYSMVAIIKGDKIVNQILKNIFVVISNFEQYNYCLSSPETKKQQILWQFFLKHQQYKYLSQNVRKLQDFEYFALKCKDSTQNPPKKQQNLIM
eukprot:TRINITY_DN2344_c0_g1_i1.p5 TRINITY_DN2344_c0_g1~~TRINITY_DN2344_c0_g1_i1.p5  ORF type:complete len:101 (+),score=9.39 TRINITY_DN2344_c0_g1_i1:1566-1868(+)